ncbi:MAG: TOBE domain-containing protein, partial [Acidimicrobiales bacterium]
QLGDPETLYEHPTTRFVAGFLGVSNLLGGTCQGTDNGLGVIQLRDGTIVHAPAAAVYGRIAVDVGVRPEKIRLHHDGGDGASTGRNQLAGTVTDASYMGVSTQYTVETRGGARVVVYEQNRERTTREELWARGDEVHITWSVDHTFVVDVPATDAVGATATDAGMEGDPA